MARRQTVAAGAVATALQTQRSEMARQQRNVKSIEENSAAGINNDDWNGADLEIENGGTGASSAEAARANLNVPSIGHTHNQSDIDGLADELNSIKARLAALEGGA